MSRVVVGYVDRKPVYHDEGPAFARRQGNGGSSLGHFQGIVLTHAQRRAKGSATEAERLGHRRGARET